MLGWHKNDRDDPAAARALKRMMAPPPSARVVDKLHHLLVSNMRLPTCAILLPFLSNQICKMSSLLVRPVQHSDIATCAALRTATLGSLVIGRPPPFSGYKEDQMASIKNGLDNKPHVHHFKVIDMESDDEIIAYATREIYPHGRPDLEALKQPMDEESKKVDQYGRLREAAYEYFCTRNGEMGKHPHIREFDQNTRILKSEMHAHVPSTQSWPFLSPHPNTDEEALAAF